MMEDKFIEKNILHWNKLKHYTDIIEKSGHRKLSHKELREFLHLFRKTSHDLAYARTHFSNSDIHNSLNGLIGRAHNHIYITKKASLTDIKGFYVSDLPAALHKYRSYIFMSFGVFMIGFFISFLLTLLNADSAAYFLPKEMLENINWDMKGPDDWNYPLMSSAIMVNNITVALKAFVFGIFLGVGTIYILFLNGALLGSLTGLVYTVGNPISYWSLILPHGVIELTAIFISGGVGLMLGKSLLIPGKYSRKHSLIYNAKESIPLLLGSASMLIIAGIIEGFFTPLSISPVTKLVFAGITALLLIAYYLKTNGTGDGPSTR